MVQVIVAPDAVIADAEVPERVRGATSESVAGLDEPFNVAVTVAVWSESERAGAGGERGGSGVGRYAYGRWNG